MRLHKVPVVAQRLFPGLTWRKNINSQTLFLTFDDGPIPEVTDFVLQELEKLNAKATFFCVGQNVEKHPEIAAKAAAAGHRLANHTFNHLNGWKTAQQEYTANVAKCQQALANANVVLPSHNPLFRPPYGRIPPRQTTALQPDYDIVMWDVLTYDYDAQMSPEEVLKQSIKHTQSGSVILFHDSLKARRNMEYALPRFLHHFASLNYTFAAL